MEKEKVSMMLKTSIFSTLIAVLTSVVGVLVLTGLYQEERLTVSQLRWTAMTVNFACIFLGVSIVKRNSMLPGILISFGSGLLYLFVFALLDALLFNGMDGSIIWNIAAVVVGAFLGAATSLQKRKRVLRK